nr:PREDICTED: LOW QUALITY PROTEIN: WD repeat-containing protein 66-like [Linepithema humile]
MAMPLAFPFSNRFQTDTENAESNETNVKKKRFEREFAERDLWPFKLQWSFGINPAVPVINLTAENHVLVAYACSHAAMIYNCSSRKMSPLLGHRNAVRTLSTTRDGKWLLTADFEQDCVTVIWDTEKWRVFSSEIVLQNYFPCLPSAMESVRTYISGCGLMEKTGQMHHFSLVDTTSERVKEITFNDEHSEQFALTTDYHVLFLTWVLLKFDKQERSHFKLRLSPSLGEVSTYWNLQWILLRSKVQQVFTATTNGCILVWGDVSRKENRAIDDSKYRKKKHIKTVNLQKSNITVIINNEGMLVTGNSNGRVTFYDYQLRLLYWCESCDLDSIRWISFDLRAIDSSKKHQDNGKIKIATASKLITNAEHGQRNYKSDKSIDKATNEAKSSNLPTDATIHSSPFNVRNFLACSSAGRIALIEIAKQKCRLVLQPLATVTSLDAHPESNYVIVGDAQGAVHLYNFDKRILTSSRSTPSLPDFRPVLKKQETDRNFIYVTCPQNHESLKAVTALKFSPRCDMLACGLENGTIWILHYITLDPLDEIPYKHSSVAVNKIVFTPDAEYMAYSDNALTVVVFKRNDIAASKERNLWNLIGKYHSHYLPIRDILFGPPASDSRIPRFFSLGEDRELVEYDLERSGPYPAPGLQILRIDQVEQSAIPLCLAWYPGFGTEGFLMLSNSEVIRSVMLIARTRRDLLFVIAYKYKIFSDVTKMVRGTYLGPTFGEPVQHLQVLKKKSRDNDYMVFATDREIGLQLLPLDGNPYRIVSVTGHPQKITGISVSNNREMMFTAGYNDPCVLMWKIRLRSVDTMAQLGGEGLSPFHRLIKDGLINEIKDLFYYTQILRQECTTAPKIVSDTIGVEQISNLMRAIGYFPTNKEVFFAYNVTRCPKSLDFNFSDKLFDIADDFFNINVKYYFLCLKSIFISNNELLFLIKIVKSCFLRHCICHVEAEYLLKQILFKIENIIAEVCYKYYVETGELVKEVTFEEFVRLYVNHRPVFELGMHQIKEAFRTFVEENFNSVETPTLTREQFMNILFGILTEDSKAIGESIS